MDTYNSSQSLSRLHPVHLIPHSFLFMPGWLLDSISHSLMQSLICATSHKSLSFIDHITFPCSTSLSPREVPWRPILFPYTLAWPGYDSNFISVKVKTPLVLSAHTRNIQTYTSEALAESKLHTFRNIKAIVSLHKMLFNTPGTIKVMIF